MAASVGEEGRREVFSEEAIFQLDLKKSLKRAVRVQNFPEQGDNTGKGERPFVSGPI